MVPGSPTTDLGACPYAPGGSWPDDGVVKADRVRVRCADAALVVVLGETLLALVGGLRSGLTQHQLVSDGLVLSNAVLGLSLALGGYPIARLRPGHRVGWMLLAAGLGFATSAAGYATLAWLSTPGSQDLGWRMLADLTNLAWSLAVTFFLPLTLLLFPDGVLPSRLWRPVVVLAAVNAAMLGALATLPDMTLSVGLGVRGLLHWPALGEATWLATASELAGLTLFGAALLSLVIRYRNADEVGRRQLLWLLLGSVVMLAAFAVNDLLRLESFLGIYVIALVPASIAVAILRYQLLDIRLVVSRSFLYVVMTGLVVVTYALIVAGTNSALSDRIPLGPPVLATLVIALGFNPVRRFVQNHLDRVFYGSRRDPVRAVAEIGSRLGETGLVGVLEGLCSSLRLPGAAIEVDGTTVASYGSGGSGTHGIDLVSGGSTVGRLVVGLRRGERVLSPRDQRVLDLVTSSVAIAVRESLNAAALQTAREALVSAREEERRRLGRDLHDGLGPVLTAVTLKADAARRLVPTDPARATELLEDLGRETTAGVQEIRRLAHELRPPVLDSLGLLGALEQHANTLGPLDVRVSGEVTSVPAAVEVAAYRIAGEALTNVVRHSSATEVTVDLISVEHQLRLIVQDNGRSTNGAWVSGVGLSSMRERAGELGGTIVAGPGEAGGRVEATLPCGGAS